MNRLVGSRVRKAAKMNHVALIGSQALLLERPKDLRVPRDIDVVGKLADINKFAVQMGGEKLAQYPIDSGKKTLIRLEGRPVIEGEIAWSDTSSELLLHLCKQYGKLVCVIDGLSRYSAPLDLLYTLKMSHRYRRNSPHFEKTMFDIWTMRRLGAKIRPEFQEFYELRQDETYDYAHPKLNVMKGDFFKDDGIKYIFDHDTIHEAMKQMHQPAYRFFKKHDAEVMCSEDLFHAQTDAVKLNAVLEESYVLALERSQIPFRNKWSPRHSFKYALEKVCSSITSGWFREYAWEHYYEVEDMYSDDYMKRFDAAVAAGIVKKV